MTTSIAENCTRYWGAEPLASFRNLAELHSTSNEGSFSTGTATSRAELIQSVSYGGEPRIQDGHMLRNHHPQIAPHAVGTAALAAILVHDVVSSLLFNFASAGTATDDERQIFYPAADYFQSLQRRIRRFNSMPLDPDALESVQISDDTTNSAIRFVQDLKNRAPNYIPNSAAPTSAGEVVIYWRWQKDWAVRCYVELNFGPESEIWLCCDLGDQEIHHYEVQKDERTGSISEESWGTLLGCLEGSSALASGAKGVGPIRKAWLRLPRLFRPAESTR